jgi:hypothetical protein
MQIFFITFSHIRMDPSVDYIYPSLCKLKQKIWRRKKKEEKPYSSYSYVFPFPSHVYEHEYEERITAQLFFLLFAN